MGKVQEQSWKLRIPREEKIAAFYRALKILHSLGITSPDRTLLAQRAARIVGISSDSMKRFVLYEMTTEERAALDSSIHTRARSERKSA